MRHPVVPTLVLVGALTVAACGRNKTPLVSSPSVPAAQGEVQSAVEANGNLKLTIEVKHLATPEKVSPGATVYVAWCELPSGASHNLGALRIDEDLAGHLDTVAPPGGVSVFITAEENPAVTTPTGPRVLSSPALK